MKRKHLNRNRILLALFACYSCLSAKAADIILTADADTYTQGGASAGAAQNLDVLGSGGNDRIAYIRFDLSSLTGTVSNATLLLHETGGTRNDVINTGRHEVYGLIDNAGNTPQNWSEAAVLNPGNEYGNTGGNDIDTNVVFILDADKGADVIKTVPGSDNVDVSITGPDLDTFLNQRLAADGLATFIVAIDSDNRGYGFASRENTTYDPPKLVIPVDHAPEPDPYPANPVRFARQAENLNRGVVAVRKASSQVYVGWRLFGTDPSNVAFNLYRSDNGATAVKLNTTPLTQTTDFVDTTANLSHSNAYFVRPVADTIEMEDSESFTLPASSPIRQFLEVPLQVPPEGTNASGSYAYTANDCSVGDLDGDGELEIVLKWDPTNSKDNSQSGYTGNAYLDAYKLDGTRLWRIDLGVNIRAGAHYTQFMVYDLDGDGKAEVACKTAEGSRDGAGTYIANDPAKFLGAFPSGITNTIDHRNSGGYILTGYEFLTVFNGETGVEMATTYYVPPRNNDINSPDVSAWGDNYGNRVDRFLAGIAYLDGVRPSLVMCRGYYTRTVLTAWDWRGGQLTRRWVFDSDNPGLGSYAGQGDHQLSVADVDGDGYDEIIYGAMVIDNDGTGLYTTGLGHGDALHVSDMDPDHPGLEVFMPHEDPGSYGNAGGEYRDAMTGELLFNIPANNDVGRGVAMDIDPNHRGYEFWAATSDPTGGVRKIYNVQDGPLYDTPGNMFYNFGVWWDADPLRELLDSTVISKWNSPGRSNFDLDPSTGGTQQYAPDCSSNNSTKSTPNLSGDILGDWREEVIWRKSDNTALRIFTTIISATNRMPTLLHDIQYREAIAWQNVAYNQPPHTSFYLGAGMDEPVAPLIYLAGVTTPIPLSISTTGISFPSSSNRTYLIESKTSLTNGTWQPFTNLVATGTNSQVAIPFPDGSMFFRGKQQ